MLKVDLELGHTERARKVAAELMSSLGRTENDEGLMQLALAAHELGIADDVSSLVARASDRRWTQIIALVADGRFEQAAEQLSEIGDRSTEAEVRLLAAAELAAGGHRGEADEQLRKALAFYRSVGATRYIREGEALLVKSA
jgi:Flp pilus assembly protein TadD